jgi:hypothetical protein
MTSSIVANATHYFPYPTAFRFCGKGFIGRKGCSEKKESHVANATALYPGQLYDGHRSKQETARCSEQNLFAACMAENGRRG